MLVQVCQAFQHKREGFRQIGLRAKPWEELSCSLARVVVLWKHLQLQGLYEMLLDGLGLVAAVCWAPVCEGRSCSRTSILSLTAPVPLGVGLGHSKCCSKFTGPPGHT